MNIYTETFMDVQDRYYFNIGKRPVYMSASHSYLQGLRKEWEDQLMVSGEASLGTDPYFVKFNGVVIWDNLNSELPTLIASA